MAEAALLVREIKALCKYEDGERSDGVDKVRRTGFAGCLLSEDDTVEIPEE